MTIQELYNWAKEKNCLDKTIAKNCNCEIFDIECVIDTSDCGFLQECEVDKVILD